MEATRIAVVACCAVLSMALILAGYYAIRQAKRHHNVELAVVGTVSFLTGVALLWFFVRLMLSALLQAGVLR